MIKKIKIIRPYLFILAAILVCALLTFVNYQYTKANQDGNSFYTNWLASRKFLLEGQNPYSSSVTEEIQTTVYGRIAEAGEEELSFSIPLYAIIFYSPFALIKDFMFARALWMTLLEVTIIAVLLVSMNLANWKIKPLILIPLIVFGLFGFHGIIPLLDGNLIILITLTVTGILVAIRNKHDEAAGLMLAFLTIMPVPVAIFFIFMIVWSITCHRTKIIVWFLGTFALLIGFSIVFIPDWILQFIRNFVTSYKEIAPGSPGGVLVDRWGVIGGRLSIIISVIIGILLIVEWWQANRAGQKQFMWTAMLTLALTTWSGIKVNPLNYFFLLPSLIMGLALLHERWKQAVYGIILSILAVLFLSNWGIYLFTMSSELKPGISSFLFIPLPIFVITLLYWSKWWVRKSGTIEFEPAPIELKKR